MGTSVGKGGMGAAGCVVSIGAAAAGMSMSMGMWQNMGMMGSSVGCGQPGMSQSLGYAHNMNMGGQHGFYLYAWCHFSWVLLYCVMT